MLLKYAAKNVRHSFLKSTSDEDFNDDAMAMDIGLTDDVFREDVYVNLYHSALHLCWELLAMKNSLSTVPTPDELRDESSIPNSLLNFVAWLLCGGAAENSQCITIDEKVKLHEEAHRHVASIS